MEDKDLVTNQSEWFLSPVLIHLNKQLAAKSLFDNYIVAASLSSGRVQHSGSRSKPSPEFYTLLVRRLVVPQNKTLHTALPLTNQEQMGTCEGRFVSRGAKWAAVYSPGVEMDIQMDRPITVTSQWTRWRIKSPASRLFTQPFIQTQIKENIKALRHWPLCDEFTGDRYRWIPRTNGQ